ncbi:MAG TPA: ribbon-helix-helix protein, CopG family [Thermoanaerobaculia bacterium]|nr:ribbon-helix-helix protein, CopG family [Thermoanaerobaculia bacterium]
MQTTLRLDDDLYRQAKARAAARGISLTRFLEDAIREHLQEPEPLSRDRRLRLPVSTATGGLMPGFSTLEEAVAATDLENDRRRLH